MLFRSSDAGSGVGGLEGISSMMWRAGLVDLVVEVSRGAREGERLGLERMYSYVFLSHASEGKIDSR